MCDECARLMPLTLVCTQHSAVDGRLMGIRKEKENKMKKQVCLVKIYLSSGVTHTSVVI